MWKNRDDYLTKPELATRAIRAPALTKPGDLLSPLVYDKAAWVLHMLRGVVGDQAFFAGVREYYATHRDGNAVTDDFRAIMERHAERSLDWFFKQWLDEPGHPVLAMTWRWRRGTLTVDVVQTQPGAVYRLPIALEIRTTNGTQRDNILIDEHKERFTIETNAKPTDVLLDFDEWLLRQ
jgi:aminopeptidase N